MRFVQIVLALLMTMIIAEINISGPARAAESRQKAKVYLVIAAQKTATITSYQEWSRALGRAGVQNVRIRAALKSDKLGIAKRGDSAYPTYDVTGMITAGGDLILPGARFEPGDAKAVLHWVDDLAQNGPPESREPRGPFGLTKGELDNVLADLRQTVGLSTHGLTRAEAVEHIAAKLRFPLRLDDKLQNTLARDKIDEDLSGFSSGTALARVLHPLGLSFAPELDDAGNLTYTVLPIDSGATARETWPVGWSPQGRRQEVLPGLFEFHTVSVQNVSLAKVLTAIGERLGVPVLVDRAALARGGIDPEKIDVSLPQARTTYSMALGRVLSKSKLKYELRVDEAGRPFLWVATMSY